MNDWQKTVESIRVGVKYCKSRIFQPCQVILEKLRELNTRWFYNFKSSMNFCLFNWPSTFIPSNLGRSAYTRHDQMFSRMELPNLGEHCSFEECNKLDFLPFKCISGCGKSFCGDHYKKVKNSEFHFWYFYKKNFNFLGKILLRNNLKISSGNSQMLDKRQNCSRYNLSAVLEKRSHRGHHRKRSSFVDNNFRWHLSLTLFVANIDWQNMELCHRNSWRSDKQTYWPGM